MYSQITNCIQKLSVPTLSDLICYSCMDKLNTFRDPPLHLTWTLFLQQKGSEFRMEAKRSAYLGTLMGKGELDFLNKTFYQTFYFTPS